MVQFNTSACIGCGLCVDDCVKGILEIKGGKARLTTDDCLGCGHCVAICPRNAVKLDGYDMNEVLPCRKEEFAVRGENLLNLIKFRRSVRKFTEEKVSDEQLHMLLEAGRFTPTGSNKQETRYIVLTEEQDEMRDLCWESLLDYSEKYGYPSVAEKAKTYLDGTAKGDALFFGAPHVLLVISTSLTDACLAAASMELTAAAMGLGAMYSGYTVRAAGNSEKIRKFLGLKDGEEVCTVLTLGHPAVTYRRTVPRKPLQVEYR